MKLTLSNTEFMWVCNKFKKHQTTNTRKAIMYMMAVCVVRNAGGLSENSNAFYETHIQPTMLRLGKEGFDGRDMPSNESLKKDAKHVLRWMEDHQQDFTTFGQMVSITHTFVEVFNV